MTNTAALRRLCGQLVVGGFEGTELTASFRQALARGERGGAILFSRNLTPDPMQCADVARTVAESAPADAPPLVAVDQEGGRVQRLKAPVLQLPPMRALASLDGGALVRRAAEALARQLAALGITMNFAPVLDVNTRAENPIIGDRAFGTTWRPVAACGAAWIAGSLDGGVLACGKHFPGHGDTTVDSHLDLPVCDATDGDPRGEHLAAFAATFGATPPAAVMTAHVLYPRIDPEWPATLSRKVLAIARGALRYPGVLVSDDLEMKAVADRWPVEECATRAIDAGCDALLVCRSEALQERAVEALARKARDERPFEERVREAHARFAAMRARVPPRPVATRAAFDEAGAMAREVEAQIAAKLEARS